MSSYNNKETYIYLFGVLRHFQHCTGHITTGSWKGRGNQYIQLARVVYCNGRPKASNYQLSHLRLSRGLNPGLRGVRRRKLIIFNSKTESKEIMNYYLIRFH